MVLQLEQNAGWTEKRSEWEVVTSHSTLDVIPNNVNVGITIGSALLMKESNSMHQLVYDDTLLNTATSK